jgi:hypothetical protein
MIPWRLREGGRCLWLTPSAAGEALHDGHELAGFGVHHLGRGGVDDDRLPHRLPDVVRIPAGLGPCSCSEEEVVEEDGSAMSYISALR